MLTIIIFILVLGLLVFIHELGHFLFAKRAGILVRDFSLGFGLKIFAKKIGETLYSIRLLPLGGYVRMAGEDPEMHEVKTGSEVYLRLNKEGKVSDIYLFEPVDIMTEEIYVGRMQNADFERDLFIQIEDEQEQPARYSLSREAVIHYSSKNTMQIAPWDRQFGSKTAGQKAMTIFAGPLFNILLTVLLFTVFVNVSPMQDLAIQKVVKDSPAEKAGLQAGDRIVGINNKQIWTSDSLHYMLASSKGEAFLMNIERHGQRINLPIKPQKMQNAYKIGVYFQLKKVGFWQSFQEGAKLSVDWTRIMLDSLGKLVTGQLSIKSLGGPVEMGHATGEVAKAGWEPLIKWTALLSLNLGIVNLLPIPALDGSRLLFIALEAVRGRPINPQKESIVHFVGLAFLMMLMLVVTYNDIVRIFFSG